MSKYLNLKNKKIRYELRPSVSKSVRVSIFLESLLLIYTYKNLKEKDIKNILLKKEKWINKHLSHRYSLNDDLFDNSKKHFIKNKEKSNKLIRKRLEEINSILKYDYENVKIKNQKTILGSCSNKNNLNFNYKLIFLPKRKMDEVIVHELSHLKIMDHSVDFYTLFNKNLKLVEKR